MTMETESNMHLSKWQKYKKQALVFVAIVALSLVLTAGIIGVMSLFNTFIREHRAAKIDVYRVCSEKHTCVEAKIVSWSGVSANVRLFPSGQSCVIDSVVSTQALWLESR